MKNSWLALLLLTVGTVGVAQSRFVHADGKYLATPDGERLLLRGTNLSNWMEPEGYMLNFEGEPQSSSEIEALFNDLIGPEAAARFWREYRDVYITEDDLHFLHNTGVNVVRIPLHYKFFVPGDDEGFRLLDRVVGWAHKYGIYVILDMHCAPGGQTGTNIDDSWGYPWLYDSPAEQDSTIKIWRRIASHYRNNPTVLGYDLLNEPVPNFPGQRDYNSSLEPLYKRITAAIRQVDPSHVIILGGAQWDLNFKVFGPPFDHNLMYSFHKYNTPPEQAVIQEYLDFRDRYNVPIWLGESGENTDAWISAFRQVLEKSDVGWTFWPYKKMQSTSAFVTLQKPEYWDEIVRFAKERKSSAEAGNITAIRPSVEHSRAALDQLLKAVRFDHCHVNPGYLTALELNVPARTAN